MADVWLDGGIQQKKEETKKAQFMICCGYILYVFYYNCFCRFKYK